MALPSPGASLAHVRSWLAAGFAGGEQLGGHVRSASVISTQSFTPGRAELDDVWPSGGWVCWWGGPAPAGIGRWPRAQDGRPLRHLLTVHLGLAAGALDEASAARWAGALVEGLPEEGTLSVFAPYAAAPGLGRGDWAVRHSGGDARDLVESPDAPDAEVVCALVHAGFTVPARTDLPSMDAAGEVWEALDDAWSSDGSDVAMSYLYGHSRAGCAPVGAQLHAALPLRSDDRHRLVASLTPPFPFWLGGGRTLEVWMRETDLLAGEFDESWCVLRG